MAINFLTVAAAIAAFTVTPAVAATMDVSSSQSSSIYSRDASSSMGFGAGANSSATDDGLFGSNPSSSTTVAQQPAGTLPTMPVVQRYTPPAPQTNTVAVSNTLPSQDLRQPDPASDPIISSNPPVSGSPSIGTVPLPGALPLFGGAVLALAMAGVAVRRREGSATR